MLHLVFVNNIFILKTRRTATLMSRGLARAAQRRSCVIRTNGHLIIVAVKQRFNSLVHVHFSYPSEIPENRNDFGWFPNFVGNSFDELNKSLVYCDHRSSFLFLL